MNAHMHQVNATFAAMFDPSAKQEAENGLFAEDANVVAEDQPWHVVASLCDDIPLDPFRQLSGDEE
jgi:hypothetical protein